LIPGMPNFAFLLLATAAGATAYWQYQSRLKMVVEEIEEPPQPQLAEERELSWDDVAIVDQIGLEVGYRLIPMVDRQQGGQLLSRIKGVRKKLTQELGFLLPTIHIRDNLDIEPNGYRISIKDTLKVKNISRTNGEIGMIIMDRITITNNGAPNPKRLILLKFDSIPCAAIVIIIS